jgi:spore maturation protein CgeB
LSTPRKVLIVSGSPDVLNTNTLLRGYVAEGFRRAFPEADIAAVPYELGVSAAQSLSPDLALVFGSVMIDGTDYDRLVDAVRRGGGCVAFWLHDDPYEFDANDRVIPLADVIFTNDAASLDYYPVTARVHHLPLGGCPITHFRAVEQRTAPDLFFCGHLFDNRRKFLDQLACRVADFERRLIIGSSDVDARVPGWYRAAIPNTMLPAYYNTALSVLNIGRDLNLANRRYGIRASTPGPRTFEAAFAGAAQIFVGDGLEITDYFEPDREILLADSAEGFLEHFARLKREPALSLAVGRAAQERAMASHTYEQRVRTLVEHAFA